MMAWMETDYSKHTHFRWKIKWWLEHLGALGIMGEITAPLTCSFCPFLFQKGESAVELAYSYKHDDLVDALLSSQDKVSTY